MSLYPAQPSVSPLPREHVSSRAGACTTRLRPILFVDDSEIDLLIAAKCHEYAGLENPLVTLRGGAPLLTYWEEQRALGTPPAALVLLDIDMPGLDGWAALARLRRLDARVPVVIVSHCDGHGGVATAKAAGADGFAAKPSTVDGYVRFFDRLANAWGGVTRRDDDPPLRATSPSAFAWGEARL